MDAKKLAYTKVYEYLVKKKIPWAEEFKAKTQLDASYNIPISIEKICNLYYGYDESSSESEMKNLYSDTSSSEPNDLLESSSEEEAELPKKQDMPDSSKNSEESVESKPIVESEDIASLYCIDGHEELLEQPDCTNNMALSRKRTYDQSVGVEPSA